VSWGAQSVRACRPLQAIPAVARMLSSLFEVGTVMSSVALVPPALVCSFACFPQMWRCAADVALCSPAAGLCAAAHMQGDLSCAIACISRHTCACCLFCCNRYRYRCCRRASKPIGHAAQAPSYAVTCLAVICQRRQAACMCAPVCASTAIAASGRRRTTEWVE